MQRYGIEIPAVNDIPFGSRAIQSGIEVDDIWISRPNTPAASQRASCATIIDDSSTDGTVPVRKGGSSLRNLSASSQLQSKSGELSSVASSKVLKRSTLAGQHMSEATTLCTQGSGALPPSQSDSFNTRRRTNQVEPQRRWSSIQTASDAAAAASALASRPSLRSEPVAYGSAEVFANTNTRRTVSGFEILPAGSLGDRVELHAGARSSEELARQRPREAPRTANKLQKPKPKKPT